jgi:predicted lipoprotein with Yx(FWY)xxD motif
MPVSTVGPVIPITGQSTATMAPAATAMPVATATMAPPAMPTSAAVVNASQNAILGSFLVDSVGMTLYIYTKDTPNSSVCYGGCATAWPPLLTNGAPNAGTGVTASMLGTTTRTDGTVQVTYHGWPLYYFAKDKVAGDTTGEGVGSVWYVMTPAGMQK